MYTYTYIHMYIHVYIYIYIYVCVCVLAYMRVYMCVYIYIYIVVSVRIAVGLPGHEADVHDDHHAHEHLEPVTTTATGSVYGINNYGNNTNREVIIFGNDTRYGINC